MQKSSLKPNDRAQINDYGPAMDATAPKLGKRARLGIASFGVLITVTAIAVVAAVAWVVAWGTPNLWPNPAQDRTNQFVKGISSLHPTLVCGDGSNGHSFENMTPSYTAYYYIDSTSNVSADLTSAASQIGIALSVAPAPSSNSTPLKGGEVDALTFPSTTKFSQLPNPLAVYDPSATYLVDNSHMRLQVVIEDQSIRPECSTFGGQLPAKDGKSILVTVMNLW